MSYGIESHTTRGILAAAGLLDAVKVYHDEPVIEVDVVFEGAVDESFAVDPARADDVAEVLFEQFCLDFDLCEFEVSVWDRTFGTVGTNLRTFGHAADGDVIDC